MAVSSSPSARFLVVREPPLRFLVCSDIANVHIVPMPMTFGKNGPSVGLARTF